MPSTLNGIGLNPLTNFSERDIVQLFRKANFVNIHMEFHLDVRAGPAMPWSTFIEIAPRPGTPSLREIFEQHLTAAEVELLEGCMRAAVENGTMIGQTTTLYLTAEKRL